MLVSWLITPLAKAKRPIVKEKKVFFLQFAINQSHNLLSREILSITLLEMVLW